MIQKLASIIQGEKNPDSLISKNKFHICKKKKQDPRNNSKSLIKESKLQRKNIELFNLL